MCSASSPTPGSWVTRRMVLPSAWSSPKSSRISSLVCVSRLPVASSARISAGSLISARAMAARCCWPPESSDGRWCIRSPRPTFCRSSVALALSCEPAPLPKTAPSTTFSRAVNGCSRLKVWKTMPTCSARNRSRAVNRSSFTPSIDRFSSSSNSATPVQPGSHAMSRARMSSGDGEGQRTGSS